MNPPYSSRTNAGAALLALAWLGLATALTASQVKTSFVRVTRDEALSYTPDAQGNRIPDFSAAGYAGGGVPLPVVPARVRVSPITGDATALIQAAIDAVAALPPDANGFRGAVVLAKGRYEIGGNLKISTGGVVLRGEGDDETGTVLVATGTDRRTLIQVAGRNDRTKQGAVHKFTDAYVPVGATVVTVDGTPDWKVGARVLVTRPSPKEWIAALGMDDAPGRQPFAWPAGKIDVEWERTILAVAGNRLTFDAPLTTALEARFGGGTVTAITWAGRLAQVGIENLRCESQVDPANPKDEQHAWMAIGLDAVENAWIAKVTAVHFASSAVQLGVGTRAITVQDCRSLAPVSEIGGYRRHSFHSSGQLTLFLRCSTDHGIHDFTVGYMTSGPNVFYDCRANHALDWSGSIGSWASGVLFDNVRIDGAALRLDNLETWNQGVGWSLANSVIWQSSASVMVVRRPPTANNWAVGPWAEFVGDGWWDQVNEFVRPDSLYATQLRSRLGAKAIVALEARTLPASAFAAPALEPMVPDLATRLKPTPPLAGQPLALEYGWLVANGALLIGKPIAELQWWRGLVAPNRLAEFGPGITRFVPGQVGVGLTDDLDVMTEAMRQNHEVVVRHHYGLWYDRRRMDHERVRRATPDDWPPFFEQPFARSGQGEAWDRMSRYDLTKYNSWYFGRLHEFAELARQKGLVLINEMYFQHNILEAGAHWVDCPWRPENCLQTTDFPEPPPFTDNDGNPAPTPDLGKRIFMADRFYDPNHAVRGPLHRAFIRHCLEILADEPNAIHTLTAENSGPLSFMQFWLDVVAEWEAETGKHPLIALSAPKDVQDAILADPRRAAVVDVIDLTYWWRLDDGKLFAPKSGTVLAPRQHEREWHGGRPSPTALAGMVREYRATFPQKAVITALEQGDGWLFAAAGGSLAKLPAATEPALRIAIARMQPVEVSEAPKGLWALGESGQQYLLARAGSGETRVQLKGAVGRYEVRRVDTADGKVTGPLSTLDLSGPVTLPSATGRTAVWWLVKAAN